LLPLFHSSEHHSDRHIQITNALGSFRIGIEATRMEFNKISVGNLVVFLVFAIRCISSRLIPPPATIPVKELKLITGKIDTRTASLLGKIGEGNTYFKQILN